MGGAWVWGGAQARSAGAGAGVWAGPETELANEGKYPRRGLCGGVAPNGRGQTGRGNLSHGHAPWVWGGPALQQVMGVAIWGRAYMGRGLDCGRGRDPRPGLQGLRISGAPSRPRAPSPTARRAHQARRRWAGGGARRAGAATPGGRDTRAAGGRRSAARCPPGTGRARRPPHPGDAPPAPPLQGRGAGSENAPQTRPRRLPPLSPGPGRDPSPVSFTRSTTMMVLTRSPRLRRWGALGVAGAGRLGVPEGRAGPASRTEGGGASGPLGLLLIGEAGPVVPGASALGVPDALRTVASPCRGAGVSGCPLVATSGWDARGVSVAFWEWAVGPSVFGDSGGLSFWVRRSSGRGVSEESGGRVWGDSGLGVSVTSGSCISRGSG